GRQGRRQWTGGQDPSAVSDGVGGMIVAFEGGDSTGANIYAGRVAQDGPVPALLTLASAEADPGRVTLRWYGELAGSATARVERRTQTTEWTQLGIASPTGDHELEYVDPSVSPGRCAYRLSYTASGSQYVTPETWVDVPSGFSLALGGFRPNPAIESPIVS